MKIPKLKNIKDFSLLIISNHAGIQTKSYSLNAWKIAAFLASYTIILVIISGLFFGLTPIKYLFVSDKEALKAQNQEILNLNRRIEFLSGELEQISSLNKKLKYAIFLGDSNLAKSIKSLKDSVSQTSRSVSSPNGGYIYAAIKKLFYINETQQTGSFLSGISAGNDSDINFAYPVELRFTSRDFSASKGHMGIDFPVKSGAPVFAASGGIVIFSDYTAEDGNMIILMHKNNYITVYKHCSVLIKKLRDKVTQGETIALSGNTGLNSTGPHLHFEVWRDGQAIDPKKILTQ
ncbi:MAG: M23 family metallopeptidase [Bacillota bacterium]